jgi:hypothetical protein
VKLTEAKILFEKCRNKSKGGFIIKRHCWADHQRRGFDREEVELLLYREGRLVLNRFPSAKPDSFLWECKDDFGENVEIVLLFDGEEIVATAISAYRKDKK